MEVKEDIKELQITIIGDLRKTRPKTSDTERQTQAYYIKIQVKKKSNRKSDFRCRKNYDLIKLKILGQQKTEEPFPLK